MWEGQHTWIFMSISAKRFPLSTLELLMSLENQDQPLSWLTYCHLVSSNSSRRLSSLGFEKNRYRQSPGEGRGALDQLLAPWFLWSIHHTSEIWSQSSWLTVIRWCCSERDDLQLLVLLRKSSGFPLPISKWWHSSRQSLYSFFLEFG